MEKYLLKTWEQIKGDETLRLDYNLNENSIIFDIGSYKGNWAEKIFNKYNCYIFMFEPVKEYYEICVEKFKNNEKIKIFNYGLSNLNCNTLISKDEDASSINKQDSELESIHIYKFSKIVKELNISNIDLMKINIEGEEYNLLKNILSTGVRINNLQIQFHNFVDDANSLRNNIYKLLEEKYFITYRFDWIWENWSLKNIDNLNYFYNQNLNLINNFISEMSLLLKNKENLELKLNDIKNSFEKMFYENNRSFSIIDSELSNLKHNNNIIEAIKNDLINTPI